MVSSTGLPPKHRLPNILSLQSLQVHLFIWAFPEMGVPLNDWDFLLYTIHFGVPPFKETSICSCEKKKRNRSRCRKLPQNPSFQSPSMKERHPRCAKRIIFTVNRDDMYTYIHTYMHACIHTYIHPCMHTYIHTYIHAYIHTYIHTYIHNRYVWCWCPFCWAW